MEIKKKEKKKNVAYIPFFLCMWNLASRVSNILLENGTTESVFKSKLKI